jgi:hypothetical protein
MEYTKVTYVTIKASEILLTGKGTYKKGDRVVANFGSKKTPEYYIGTVTSSGMKVAVLFDDGDKHSFPKSSYKLMGLGIKRKRKTEIPKKDINKYMVDSPKSKPRIVVKKSEWSGPISFKGQPITELPKGLLKIDGTLDLENTKIKKLPDNLKIKGSLRLEGTPITKLPKGLEIGAHLILEGTNISSLPKDIKIGKTLYAKDSKLTKLPANLKVGGDLDLTNTPIKKLPKGLEVDGSLRLKDTDIDRFGIPKDIIVESVQLSDGKVIYPANWGKKKPKTTSNKSMKDAKKMAKDLKKRLIKEGNRIPTFLDDF